MHLRALTLAAAVLATLLAGCASEPSERPAEDDAAFEDLDLSATDSTGVIRGVVVDSAVRPLLGATVALTGSDARQASTDENGAFGFSGLAPGTYFLQASKPGFFPAQQSVEVVAGESEPPAVKIQLVQDAGYVAYVSAQVFEGFIECTSSLLVVCGLPNSLTGQQLTNDRYTPTLFFDPNATLIQSEMVWQSTQPLSPDLYFEQEALDGCDKSDETFIASVEGPSPIHTAVDAGDVQEFGIGEGACGIYYSVFSAGLVGVTLQQRFSLYVHAFHGYLPPEDWVFSATGVAPQPPQ